MVDISQVSEELIDEAAHAAKPSVAPSQTVEWRAYELRRCLLCTRIGRADAL